jgi:hypothetical protein
MGEALAAVGLRFGGVELPMLVFCKLSREGGDDFA